MKSFREQFEEWATCHYSGFEGGNLEARYWFCGIEYGGNEFNFERVKKLDVVDNELYDACQYVNGNKVPYWKKIRPGRLPYADNVAKFSCLLEEDKINNWREHKKTLFTKSGDTFKMNLFPLTFPNEKDNLWTEEYERRLEFNNKQEYREWCKEKRSPLLNSIVAENKPHLLICTGIGCIDYFKAAFLEKDAILEKHGRGAYECYSTRRRDTKTLVMITKFFGQFGIRKDSDYIQLSHIAKELLQQ